MGLFYKYLHEAEEDDDDKDPMTGNPGNDDTDEDDKNDVQDSLGDDTSTNDSDSSGNSDQEDPMSGNPGDEADNNDTGGDDNNSNGSNGLGGTETSDPENTGETSDDDTDTSDGDDQPVENQSDNELKQIEIQLFADLSTDQLAIKNRELKSQYLALYDVVSNLINRINGIARSDYDIKVFEFVSIKLEEMRNYIVDYINDVYDTVSYTEAAINYNKYLAVLSYINKIFAELSRKSG